jgi:hypothetical protein
MPRYSTLHLDDAALGREVTVWDIERGHRTTGQGGTLFAFNDKFVTIATKFYGDRTYDITKCSVEVEDTIPLTECIQYDPAVCDGEVDFFSPRGLGGPLRCQVHVDQRMQRYQDPNSMERYAHSDIPPSDFDPALIGESWDGE